eukprot:jgi/Tetstr1/425916/TSEL_001592.t2
MDQDKTCLPHLVPWDKKVERKNLLQCHLTCVKYNGSQPDDVYYFFDCFPHDSNNTVSVMYKTIKKEIERRGVALDTVWFQLDNTCRENKNKHSHERVDQVFSKFSVWLDDHAAFTKAQLLHELQHGPEFILRGVPDGTPAYLASRPLKHSKADLGKAFAEMEKEIWEAADRYADLHEELRVLTYNPITINTSTQRRKRRRGAQAATTTAWHSMNEADSEGDRQEGGQGVAIPLENEDTTRREFDARPGNLVVMDNTADNADAYREEGLLGDWENKYLVAYLRYRYDVHDLDGLPEDHIEVDELDVTMHMEITYELAILRAALNVHKLDVDNKRRWFNDHRFNADKKKWRVATAEAANRFQAHDARDYKRDGKL